MRRQDHRLTPEQIDLVHWNASLGAVTAEALSLRLGITMASARGRLSSAQRRGLIARAPLGSPALFTVTRAGLRAAQVHGIDPVRVSPGGANHSIVCASVAAALERCYPDHRLIGEHELRRDERDCGRALASAVLGWTGSEASCKHSPDLVLWPSDGDGAPVAIEVELTIKGRRRLAGICRAWARCRSIAGVVYLAPPDVERALKRAIEEARAWEHVV